MVGVYRKIGAFTSLINHGKSGKGMVEGGGGMIDLTDLLNRAHW